MGSTEPARLTLTQVAKAADRVINTLETTRSGEDAMFRAALHIMRDRLINALAVELQHPAGGRWRVNFDGHRYTVEHSTGRVLSQRRGKAWRETPIYFVNRAGAEARAREMNDADLQTDHGSDQEPDCPA